jgi:hypothetical protein
VDDVYLHCTCGQDDPVSQQIEDALSTSDSIPQRPAVNDDAERSHVCDGIRRKKADYPNFSVARSSVRSSSSRSCRARAIPCRAESVLTPRRPSWPLPAETAAWSTITQTYDGTNRIQRMVIARQLLK